LQALGAGFSLVSGGNQMATKNIMFDDFVQDLELSLKDLGYTLEDFAALEGDEIDDWDLQGLWFMFHDKVIAWMNEHNRAAA
jgi:hypothetical protein